MSKTNEMLRYYWDTCILITYLNSDSSLYDESEIDNIEQILKSAQNGDCQIYCSTITIAEITRSNKNGGHDMEEFNKLWGGSIIPISPDPYMMQVASELRSVIYYKTKGNRQLHTVDAIHLATAIALVDNMGIKLDAFHTFDNGGKKGMDGKGVPLLDYEAWCDMCKDNITVSKAIKLNRCKPEPIKSKLLI